MRVLLVTPDYPPAPGGIQLVMRRLVDHLASDDVRVVTLAFDGEAPPTGEGCPIYAGRRGRSGNKLSNLALNGTAVRVGARFRPDVVISGHAVAALGAVAVGRLTGAKVLQYLHADEARQRPRLLRFAVGRAAGVVAVSSHARDLGIEAGAAPERIRVIHPGVDPVPRHPGPRAERPTVITIARMQAEYKGHDTILRALPGIRRQVPGVRWVVLGEGRLRPRWEALAAELGLDDAVDFLGHVSDAERDRLLAEAHVFAMPSRLPPGGRGGEGFGIVYLEAGAQGLPVVAGAVGGAVDAVVDGETGVLVDPTDPDAVGGAIAGLLLEPQRAEALGRAGAARARELTWERHAREVRDLMTEVAGG